MKMEEQKLEQVEVEEHEEEETTLIRKSINRNDSKTTEIAAADVEVSDGVSVSSGHTFQSEVAENGAKNEELVCPKNEQKIEELNGVLENESEAISVEKKSHNLVFYDEVEGVESISTYSGEKQILTDAGPKKFHILSLDVVVPDNSTSTVDSRYDGEIEKKDISSTIEIESAEIDLINGDDISSTTEIESAEIDLINGDDLEVKELDVERVLQKQTTHDLYCPNCNSCITKRVILCKRKRRVRISDEEVKRNRTETAVDSKLVTGAVQSPSDQVGHVDAQVTAVDEDERDRGLHIFRCLSCFSFFIPTGNGLKLFCIFGDKSGKGNVQDEQAPSVKNNWFTSMFAPNKQDTAFEQGSSFQTNVRKGDAVLASSNLGDQSGRPSILQKPRSPVCASEGLVGRSRNNDTWEGGENILPFRNQKPSINGKVAISVGDKLDMNTTETIDATMEQFDSYSTDQLMESKSSQEGHVNWESDLSVTTLPMRTQDTNGKSAEDTISFSQEGGLKLLISANKESLTLQKEAQIPNQTADKEVIQHSPTSVSVLKASDVDGKLNISVSIPHEEQDVKATIVTESVLENKNANFSSSHSGQVCPSDMSQHIISKTKIEVHSGESLKVDNISVLKDAAGAQGKDTVIVIDTQTGESSQTVEDIIHATETASVSQSMAQSSVCDSGRREARNEFQIEVIKSILYGGLAESITSLSVVSSATGGGAATSNVLALGAANLIGGLFIIFHNLWDLKYARVEQVSNQITKQRDRYEELLGRRQNFILHATVAIISYLIFGLVPPLVYGFSFRKSDDKQLKLVVVGATALLCILVLAIGKAYIQRTPKPYFKTVITYVILGFMVSGVSYAAGELVERLLEKLGLFQTGSVPNIVVPEMTPTGSGWASY